MSSVWIFFLFFETIFLDLSGVTIFESLACKSVHQLKVKFSGALIVLVILMFFILSSCTNGTSKVDPSISDDLLNVSKALSEGKSVSEALGTVKW